jgi:hypothetical protein
MAAQMVAPIGGERRKDTRYRVHLKGRLLWGENSVNLEVGDLSASGALILVKDGPKSGATAELWIENYGPIAIRIMHSGAYFCGIAFEDAASLRPALRHWLNEDSPMETTAA